MNRLAVPPRAFLPPQTRALSHWHNNRSFLSRLQQLNSLPSASSRLQSFKSFLETNPDFAANSNEKLRKKFDKLWDKLEKHTAENAGRRREGWAYMHWTAGGVNDARKAAWEKAVPFEQTFAERWGRWGQPPTPEPEVERTVKPADPVKDTEPASLDANPFEHLRPTPSKSANSTHHQTANQDGEIDLITLRRIPRSTASTSTATTAILSPEKKDLPEVGETPDASAEYEKSERKPAERESENISEKDQSNEEHPSESFKQWRENPEQKRQRDEILKSEGKNGEKKDEEWVGFEESVPVKRDGEKPKKVESTEKIEGAEQHWVWEDDLHSMPAENEKPAEKPAQAKSEAKAEVASAPHASSTEAAAAPPPTPAAPLHRTQTRTSTKPHIVLTLGANGLTRLPLLLNTPKGQLAPDAVSELLQGLNSAEREAFLPEIAKMTKKGYALVGGDKKSLVFEKVERKALRRAVAGTVLVGGGLLVVGGTAPEAGAGVVAGKV